MFSLVEFTDAAGETRSASIYDLCIHRYRRQNDSGYTDRFTPVLSPTIKPVATSVYTMMVNTEWSGDLISYADGPDIPPRWLSGPKLVYWLTKGDPVPEQWTLVNNKLCRVTTISLEKDEAEHFLDRWNFWFGTLEEFFATTTD